MIFKPLFPDDDTILAIAQAKQAEADATADAFARRELQREANSYRILAEAKQWLAGELKPPT